MGNVTLYYGPMWAGKTTRLANKIADKIGGEKIVGIYDDLNTRGSSRDIVNLLIPEIKKKVVFAPDSLISASFDTHHDFSLIVFDELHLYQVLKQEKLFWQRFHFWRKEEDCDIVIASVYLDCYDSYRPFSFVGDVMAYCDVCVRCKSFVACAKCHSAQDVLFTQNVVESNSKIGDHYQNVCAKCAGKEK